MTEQRGRSEELPSSWPAEWPETVVTPGDVVNVLFDESKALIERHANMITAGLCSAPDPGTLRKAMALHRAQRFIQRSIPHLKEINELIKRREGR